MKISNRGFAPKNFNVEFSNVDQQGRTRMFKLSWSKINLFLKCPCCFYKEQVFRVKRPGIDPETFSLHNVIDKLWKREFDQYREKNEPHPLMIQSHIDAVPFNCSIVEDWRNYKTGGIQYIDQEKGLVISGVIDDLWINSSGELIVVDYKTTANSNFMSCKGKLTISNQRQLSFYAHLLKCKNFLVHDTGYFVYSKVVGDKNLFNQRLDFESSILPYTIDDSWVEKILVDIRNCLDQSQTPEPSKYCDVCKFTFNREKQMDRAFNE